MTSSLTSKRLTDSDREGILLAAALQFEELSDLHKSDSFLYLLGLFCNKK